MAGAGHQLTLVAHSSSCTECHWWHLHTSDGALGPVVYWWHIYHCSWCIGTLGMDKRTLLIVQSSLLFTQNISVHLCFQGGVCCAFVCSSSSDQKLQVTSFQLGKYQLCWTQCVLSEDITNIKSSGQPVRYMQILTFDWRVGPKNMQSNRMKSRFAFTTHQVLNSCDLLSLFSVSSDSLWNVCQCW